MTAILQPFAMSVSDYSSRNKDLAFGTKNFDYMPSHRSERKRYSFSLLSQPSKAQLLRVHQSSVIKPYITRSAKKGFNYNVRSIVITCKRPHLTRVVIINFRAKQLLVSSNLEYTHQPLDHCLLQYLCHRHLP